MAAGHAGAHEAALAFVDRLIACGSPLFGIPNDIWVEGAAMPSQDESHAGAFVAGTG